MIVIPSSPPPVPLHAYERTVVTYLRDHRFTVPDGLKLVTTPAFAKIADGPFRGATPIAEAMPGTVVVDETLRYYSPEDVARILLHETLHETPTGGAFTYATMTPRQFTLNEGATDAMTQDILKGLLRRLHLPTNTAGSDPTYPTLVARVRLASAAACSCPWTAPPAHSWRGRYFLTMPDQRAEV